MPGPPAAPDRRTGSMRPDAGACLCAGYLVPGGLMGAGQEFMVSETVHRPRRRRGRGRTGRPRRRRALRPWGRRSPPPAVLEVTADDAVEPRRGCDVDGTLTWQQDGACFELTRLEPSLTVGWQRAQERSSGVGEREWQCPPARPCMGHPDAGVISSSASGDSRGTAGWCCTRRARSGSPGTDGSCRRTRRPRNRRASRTSSP